METYIFLGIGLIAGVAIGYLWASASKGAAISELRAQLSINQQQSAADAERREAELQDLGDLKAIIAPIAGTVNELNLKVTQMDKARGLDSQRIADEFMKNAQSQDRLNRATTALASTLGNNQKRGQWGEMHLTKLLEELGMQEGVDYIKQTKTVNESGAPIKPDVIIRMTEGRFMAVDAKVPLSYFDQAMQISLDSGNDAEVERKNLLQKHVGAVKKHIDDISAKVYHSGLEASPEFTLLYIPTETVYSATLELDNTLLDYAFKKHVVLVSPSSLYASLKAVMYSWQQHVQEDFIKEVLATGQTLFKNLSVMADHIQEVGKGLKKMVTSYNAFIGSVETKFLKPVTNLNETGSRALSSQDNLPQLDAIDIAVRDVTKNELQSPKNKEIE